VDSYITIAELDVLVSQIFTSAELLDIGWGQLTSGDKQVYLTRAMLLIESLNYRGVKEEYKQELSFPRLINSSGYYSQMDFFPIESLIGGFIHTGIPDNLKKALAHIVVMSIQDTSSSRKKLQRQGVKSLRAGDVAETYIDDASLKVALIDEYIIRLYLSNLVVHFGAIN
jgi:hypothetical protein